MSIGAAFWRYMIPHSMCLYESEILTGLPGHAHLTTLQSEAWFIRRNDYDKWLNFEHIDFIIVHCASPSQISYLVENRNFGHVIPVDLTSYRNPSSTLYAKTPSCLMFKNSPNIALIACIHLHTHTIVFEEVTDASWHCERVNGTRL